MKNVLTATVILFFSLLFTKIQAGVLMDKINEKNLLTICADPYNWPGSSNMQYPRGYDINLIEQIVGKAGYRLDIYWSDTGTRGGLGKALRNSISKGRCQMFVGIGIDYEGEIADELAEKDLILSDPYLGIAYVPVVDDSLTNINTLDDLLNSDERIGVSMATAIDGFFIYEGDGYADKSKADKRQIYPGNRRVMDAMAKGEIRAAMVWSAALPQAIRKHKNSSFRIIDSIPTKELGWNVGVAIPKEDPELLEFINKNIKDMLDNGTIKNIVEGYNMPYFQPFDG